MSLTEEIEELRRRLQRLAAEPESDLAARYALRFPPREQLSPYRWLRMVVGQKLRDLGLMKPAPLEPWVAGLKHLRTGGEDARPFLIWAFDVDRDVLRDACREFASLLQAMPGRVPVLVTDVADFAFFSRLGWLVEYVPPFSDCYAGRKQRYLAWRYRDAQAVPVSAGLRKYLRTEELLLD